MNPLFCLIRRKWIGYSPEEEVRQHLLKQMITELGYSQHSILVEQSLTRLASFITFNRPPLKRIDILVLRPQTSSLAPLSPLLLIECKARPLTTCDTNQLTGYLYYLRSSFFALADPQRIYIGSAQQPPKWCEQLPSYAQLISVQPAS